MNKDPIDEQKFLEVDKPVSARKAKELDEDLKRMDDMALKYNNTLSVSTSSSSVGLTVGYTHYSRNNGVWTREARVRNPQYNPNKVKYGNAWCNMGTEMQIIIFSYPIGIKDFHGTMMKLFKRLGWKYTSQLQVEGCEDSIWSTKKFPKYSLSMNGTVRRVKP